VVCCALHQIVFFVLCIKELSYRKQIARKLFTQYVEGINSISVTLIIEIYVKGHSRSLKLLPFVRLNYGAILYRLRDVATYWWKIAKFLYLTCIQSPSQGVIPSQFREGV